MRNRLAVAASTLLVFAVYVLFPSRSSGAFPWLVEAGKTIGPYGYALIVNLIGIALPILVLWVTRRSLIAALRELGLAADPIRPLLFGLVATSPAWIGFLLTARPNHGFTAREFILLCWLFPLAEEVMFRAFAFGQLNGRAGWSFWPAALVPAVVFGASHLHQSDKATELAGIFAITAFGSVVFSYFFVRFGRNLWAPFALHAFLNTWWMVFTTNESALGGLADNVFRFGSIALAFGIAFAALRVRPLRLLVPSPVARPAP
jgi:membrane protease YdiL (CAAX protease family)